MNNATKTETGHAIALAVESWLAPHGLRVCDYSTMAKGSWRIERDMPNARGYVEFWNETANGWCSACTVYDSELEAFGRAVLLVANGPSEPRGSNQPKT